MGYRRVDRRAAAPRRPEGTILPAPRRADKGRNAAPGCAIRPGAFALLRTERRRVPGDVVRDERLDEPVAVVVPGLPSQPEPLARACAGGFEQLGSQLFGEKFVVSALVDEDLVGKRSSSNQLRRVVVQPRAAVVAQVAGER